MPLLWVSLAFLIGIALNGFWRAPLEMWLAFTLLSAIGVWAIPGRFTTLKPSDKRIIIVSLAAFLLGAFRYQLTIQKLTSSDVAWYNDRKYEVLVTGWVVDPPDYRDTYTNLRLRVKQLDTGKDVFKAGGLLLVRVPVNDVYRYGDILRVRGKLETPPVNEDFSYRDYLARQGILSYMPQAEATLLPGRGGNSISAAIYAVKERSLENVYRLFPDPEASLLAGIILGVDSGLPAPLQQAFKDTGTAHIIAISGFNISIIAGIFILLFSRILGPRRGAIAAVLGIVFYTLLVGASAAVVRAAIMGAFSIFAMQVGRRQQGLNTLAFVAALMALWNPLFIWDAGFQLSFFATLGLILYGEPFQRAAERFIMRFTSPETARNIAQPISGFVLLTFAAQITTIPIMAYQFKQISLVSFIANPFILPAQPAVMILAGIAIFISLIAFPLGQLAAWISWPLAAYTIRMVELFDSLPLGVIYLQDFSLAFVFIFYAALLAVTFSGSRLKDIFLSLRERFRYLSAITILAVLFIGALLIWRAVIAGPDGKLHVTYLDAGSADAVLIETPEGRHILINGGPSASSLSDALGRRLSPLDRSLDWLIIASTDENQLASLPRVLDRYPPKNVLWSGNRQASFSSRSVDKWLADHSIPVTQAREGQTLDLGKGATLKVLSVSPRGATLLIEWNGFRALFPIGEDFDTLDQLEYGNAVGPVAVLSLAQSGYAPLTPVDWIDNLNPQLILLGVAAGDKNGLPDQETLDALAKRSLLRTDRNGWIDVSTDSQKMWVEVEKK
ncbi:MAG: ComEC/Rec2 family competence protein [Chloroflexi bacterium]|nr:ComEC/Rec2 family competence protein [Chloroflexota bacterium]